MKLTDILQKTVQNNHYTENTDASFSRQIKNLVPQTSVQGEIMEKNGKEVQIRLSDNTVINARLDQDVNVEEGQKIFFLVKNNGSTLELSPLLTNTSQTDNIYKALDMAGLPVNESTVSMTDQMMKLGMSIDVKSLQSVFQDTLKYPETPAKEVVLLHKLKVPVNDNNLSQLKNYEELQHELVKGMDDVVSKLSDAFTKMTDKEGPGQAVKMYQEIIKEFLPETVMNENTSLTAKDFNALAKLFAENETIAKALSETPELWKLISDKIAGDSLPEEKLTAEKLTAEKLTTEKLAEEKLTNGNPEGEKLTGEKLTGEKLTGENTISDILTGADTTAEDIRKDIGKLFQLLSMADSEDPAIMQAMHELFSTKGFEGAVREFVKNQWMLLPDALIKEGEVEKVYEKMVRQLRGLEEVLNHTGSENVYAARESIQNLSSNIDFMNQVNQMYTYVQLPLKMQNGDKNGELYVFTNKRSLAGKEGEVSALLHLNMEHLGPLDVYVKMLNGKVSTDFTVADEDTLDFLKEHMQILTDRLQKRGYDISCNLKVKEEKDIKNPVDTLIEAQNHAAPVFSQYAFDVRA